jgi:hypothetical protein
MGKTSRSGASMSSADLQLTPLVRHTTPLRDPVYVVSQSGARSHTSLVAYQKVTEKGLSEHADACTYVRIMSFARSITH